LTTRITRTFPVLRMIIFSFPFQILPSLLLPYLVSIDPFRKDSYFWFFCSFPSTLCIGHGIHLYFSHALFRTSSAVIANPFYSLFFCCRVCVSSSSLLKKARGTAHLFRRAYPDAFTSPYPVSLRLDFLGFFSWQTILRFTLTFLPVRASAHPAEFFYPRVVFGPPVGFNFLGSLCSPGGTPDRFAPCLSTILERRRFFQFYYLRQVADSSGFFSLVPV